MSIIYLYRGYTMIRSPTSVVWALKELWMPDNLLTPTGNSTFLDWLS